MRVSKKALTVAATWADMHNKPVMLGDIPWQLLRYNLVQENHMVNLQEMLGQSLSYAHAENESVHEGTLRTNPHFLLHSHDQYMAAILQSLSDEPDAFDRPELADMETVFVVCGYGQSRSIPHYIYQSPKVKENKLSEVCDFLPRYQTLMSRDTAEM